MLVKWSPWRLLPSLVLCKTFLFQFLFATLLLYRCWVPENEKFSGVSNYVSGLGGYLVKCLYVSETTRKLMSSIKSMEKSNRPGVSNSSKWSRTKALFSYYGWSSSSVEKNRILEDVQQQISHPMNMNGCQNVSQKIVKSVCLSMHHGHSSKEWRLALQKHLALSAHKPDSHHQGATSSTFCIIFIRAEKRKSFHSSIIREEKAA